MTAGSNPANLPPAQWYSTEGVKGAGEAIVLTGADKVFKAPGVVLATGIESGFAAYNQTKAETGSANMLAVAGATSLGLAVGVLSVTVPGSVRGPLAKPENMLGSARAVREYVGNIPGLAVSIITGGQTTLNYQSRDEKKEYIQKANK